MLGFFPIFLLTDIIGIYPDILADVYSLTPSEGKTSYLLSLFQDALARFPSRKSWVMQSRKPSKLMFRLLAYDIRRNQTLGSAERASDLQSEIVKSILTLKELNHFTRKLNSRMDRGMPLEKAVDELMGEMQGLGKCVIS